MENLLSYEEAKELLTDLYNRSIEVFGIDGFEEEDGEVVYVSTELIEEKDSLEVALEKLWKLYQIGCRKFSITHEQS